MKFETQEKSDSNSKRNYQFSSNCCIACKRDRPLKDEGLYCEHCTNPANFRK